MDKVNPQIRDSMFKYIYSFEKYRRDIAVGLLGSSYAVAPISPVTLEDIFLRGMQNDLGLLVGDTVILLVEAQSTVPANIAIRMLLYVTKTISDQIYKSKVPSIYGCKPIRLPAVKTYVVFTSDEIIPDYYTLGSHFAGTSDLDLNVHVLTEITPNLPSSVYEYIRFSKQVNVLVNRGVKGINFVKELIDACIKNNILIDLIVNRFEEVKGMMSIEERREIELAKFRDSLREEGREEGREESLKALMNSLQISEQEARRLLKMPDAKGSNGGVHRLNFGK